MKKSLLAAALAALLPAAAAAFHPLIGEDTLFLGRDVKQAELGFEHAVTRGGAKLTTNAGTAVLSYGLFDRVDVLMSAVWHGWTSRGISQSGIGDVGLETKFPVGEKAGWEFALKPGFSLPAGNEGQSLGAGKGGVWLYGISGRRSGAWEFWLNAGYLLNRNSLDERENIFKGSAAAVRGIAPKLKASAELAAETNRIKGSSSTPFISALGLIWSPYPTLDLDAGYRLGLTDAAADDTLLLGLTLRI